MSSNERLFAAGLMDAYDRAVAAGDIDEINRTLAQVGLRQDADGNIRTFDNDA